MTYDPKNMPTSLEEWNSLVDFYTTQSKTKYAAEVARAKAQAEAAYARLPADMENKPTLAEYVAQALSVVEPPKDRAYFESMYACYYPQEQPVFVEAELTPEQKLAQARDMIDAETSAAILAGFDYEINGENLHFNYDAFDQQNFADTANGCLMQKAGLPGLPETVGWNAYRHNGELVRLTLTADEFLALYAGGALAHKAVCMETGGQKKAALA